MQEPIKITINCKPEYEQLLIYTLCTIQNCQYFDTTISLSQATDAQISQRFSKLRNIRYQKMIDLQQEIEYLFKLERTFNNEKQRKQSRKSVKRS